MLVTLHFASTEVGAPATDSAAQQRLNLDRSAAAAALILAEGVGARAKAGITQTVVDILN